MSQTQLLAPLMTTEEEDAVIQARLANDEKLLRRLVRKFYAFSSLARASGSEAPGLSDSSPLDEARNAFLMDLSAYQLWLKKTDLSCKAESRQVLEYQQEKERLEQEQTLQREQISKLKAALDDAQMIRRRKMEYDSVSEKVNTLPTRSELELAIVGLESDIASINDDRDQLKRNVQARREKLEQIQKDVTFMNRLGRETMPEEEIIVTGPEEDAADTPSSSIKVESETRSQTPAPEESSSARLNPEARPFRPTGASTPLRETVLRKVHATSTNVSAAPSPAPLEEGEEKEDVLMGDVSSESRRTESSRKKIKEEKEEGEASDEESGDPSETGD